MSLEMFPGQPSGRVVEYVRLSSSDITFGRLAGVRIYSGFPQGETYPPIRDSSSCRPASMRFAEALLAHSQITVSLADIAAESQLEKMVSSVIVQVPRIEVYPGFSVTKDEYKRRFGGIDLNYFRQHMKPDIFRTFVKGMGTVTGVRELPDHSLEEYED